MYVIDCHSHYEPRILNSSGILQRMSDYNIDRIALISKITESPLYKKSEFMMSIQRNLLSTKYLRPIAKKLDESFHKKEGEWNPWYRKFFKNKKSYKILIKPDNESVFNLVNLYPKKFYGWIFLNPSLDNWENDLLRYKDNVCTAGVKIHPFWHRYKIEEARQILEYCNKINLPLMIHLGFESLKNIANFILGNKKTKIIFCHAGFPFYSDLWHIVKNSNNLFIDLSSHHVSRYIINNAVNFLGPHKCLYGVDDPYGDDFAGQKFQNWILSLKITNSEKESILGKNFLEIIKK